MAASASYTHPNLCPLGVKQVGAVPRTINLANDGRFAELPITTPPELATISGGVATMLLPHIFGHRSGGISSFGCPVPRLGEIMPFMSHYIVAGAPTGVSVSSLDELTVAEHLPTSSLLAFFVRIVNDGLFNDPIIHWKYQLSRQV